jgi:hypothetical protein
MIMKLSIREMCKCVIEYDWMLAAQQGSENIPSRSKITGTVCYCRHFQNSFKLIHVGSVYINILSQLFLTAIVMYDGNIPAKQEIIMTP